MSNKDFDIVVDGELQFYKTINEYRINKFGEPEYDKNAMNIFRSKIKHSLETLETLKPKKPSEFSEKGMEKIIKERYEILSENNFPPKLFFYFFKPEVRKTQSNLALAELDYYQHFLNDGKNGKGFSPFLEETEYGKMIRHGFDSKNSFICKIRKIRDVQIADKTLFIQQLAKSGELSQSEAEKDIKKHAGLFSLVSELKKRFVEPPKSRAEETIEYYLKNDDMLGLILYLEENVLPRY